MFVLSLINQNRTQWKTFSTQYTCWRILIDYVLKFIIRPHVTSRKVIVFVLGMIHVRVLYKQRYQILLSFDLETKNLSGRWQGLYAVNISNITLTWTVWHVHSFPWSSLQTHSPAAGALRRTDAAAAPVFSVCMLLCEDSCICSWRCLYVL